jgi:hypothetical protein
MSDHDHADAPAPASPAAATVEPSPSTAAAEPLSPTTRRKKRKVSRDLGAVEEAERAASKAAHRVARAVEKGVAAYREERDRSARKKRDGALRDLAANAAHGVAETLREASKAPADLAGALDSRQVRKLMRRGVSTVLSPFSRR